jgi:hypothetical protein
VFLDYRDDAFLFSPRCEGHGHVKQLLSLDVVDIDPCRKRSDSLLKSWGLQEVADVFLIDLVRRPDRDAESTKRSNPPLL